jgi:putative ABC transport system permease protein
MSLWAMAWRYAWHEPAALAARIVLVALSCTLVSILFLASAQFERILLRDSQGIDLVVGAKGSALQLVLAGVYHADTPPGNIPLKAVEALRQDRLVAQAIAIAVGDSYRGYRIVGADTELITRLQTDNSAANAMLSEGRLYAKPMEVVLGAAVASASGLRVGQSFIGAHGLAEGGPEHADQAYLVVGVLRPGAGVLDRLLFTSLESVWHTHETASSEPAQVSLALVRYASPIAAALLPRKINASEQLQAASPAAESARLRLNFAYLSAGIQALILLVSLLAVFSVSVSIAQAVRERRDQLNALRMAGAARWDLHILVLYEVLITVLLGAVLGFVTGRLLLVLVSQWLVPRAQLGFSMWHGHVAEPLFALAVLFSCLVACLWPLTRVLGQDIIHSTHKG